MKKYIRSTSSEELKRKLDLQIRKERIADLVGPVIERISDAYFNETGFELTVMKYYYREDLDAVLIEFAQFCEYGLGRLVRYTNPGRAKPSDPAMISLDASDDELVDYADGDTSHRILLLYASAWGVVLFDETHLGGCLDAGVCLYL